MRNLVELVKEAMTKRYQVDEIDLDKFKEIAEKIGNDRDGLGAAVAEIKSHLVLWYKTLPSTERMFFSMKS